MPTEQTYSISGELWEAIESLLNDYAVQEGPHGAVAIVPIGRVEDLENMFEANWKRLTGATQ